MSREERVEREDYRQEAGRDWCHYLPSRYGEDTIWRDYLRGRGLDAGLAAANQWYPSRNAGDIEYRIVIPASSLIPGNVFWQARAVGAHILKRYQSPHSPRGDAIVSVWPLDPRPRFSVVVEGPMDALAAAGEGCLGISLMGVTPPEECLRLTSRFAYGTIALVVADSDSVGAMAKVALKLLNYGLAVKLVDPHPHKDLAEAPRAERRRILGLEPELVD